MAKRRPVTDRNSSNIPTSEAIIKAWEAVDLSVCAARHVFNHVLANAISQTQKCLSLSKDEKIALFQRGHRMATSCGHGYLLKECKESIDELNGIPRPIVECRGSSEPFRF